MNARLLCTAIGVLAGTFLPVSAGLSATSARLSGSIGGVVCNSRGVPQMGATVLLYNRFDRVLQRALTSERGMFAFAALSPDVYAVRVSFASFLPALKRDILVQPGTESLLNVNLASVFSSIELVAVAPGQASLMSDEWRWVLRSATATRPVLRLFPELKSPYPSDGGKASVFSDTRGVLKVSAGDQAQGSTALGTEPDLGTAFALATSFLGSNQFQVSGNVSYAAASGAPSTGFRTSYRRTLGGGLSSPEVKVTMRQLSLPARAGAGALAGTPMLRTLSATMLDSVQLTASVRFEYGMSMDSVTFLDRLNYFSPYGRLIYERAPGETIEVGYASGTPPAEAFLGNKETDLELQRDLSALALFPRVSLRSGTARVQRTQTIEAGARKKVGSRTYAIAAYSDSISNAAVTMAGSLDGVQTGLDLLPDPLADSWTLNAGEHRSVGYLASVTQSVGSHLDVTMAYGGGGALTVDRNNAEVDSVNALRSLIRTHRRQSLTATVSGTLPTTGTQLIASYQCSNVMALDPAHMYLTERVREGLGLNVRVRQPIPYFGGLPGHMEATAELRNLLAQGYVPLTYVGRRTYLMQTARSVRGGVSFNF